MTENDRMHAAVIGGGGVMGHGIAIACLRAGHSVTIISRRPESLARGLGLVAEGDYGLNATVPRGKLTGEEAEACLARLDGTCSLQEGVARADIVFESVDEDVAAKHAVLRAAEAAKHAVLRAAEAAAPSHALFASGTSAIMIAELASADRGGRGRPRRDRRDGEVRSRVADGRLRAVNPGSRGGWHDFCRERDGSAARR